MAQICENNTVENPKIDNENESIASGADVNSMKKNICFSDYPTLEQIRELQSNFAKERNWEQYHQPRNLLLALVGEVGELSELFQWRGEVKEGLPDWTEEEREHLGQELSDVLIYLVRLSDKCHIDLPAAVMKKLVLNAKKYPASEVWGSSEKYTKYVEKHSWVPRRDENMPKTIDQIYQEAEQEASKQQINLQNISSNYPKTIPDDRDRRKASGRNIRWLDMHSEDGWTSSSSKSNKGSCHALDPTKLKLTKPDEVESIRLGPGGRGLQSWRRGTNGGTKSTAEDVKTALTNRLADSSRESSNQLPTAALKTLSTSKERQDLLETVQVFNRPTESKSRDTKKNIDAHVNGKVSDPDKLCLRGPEKSEEEMDKKTKPLIDEFLHNKDFEPHPDVNRLSQQGRGEKSRIIMSFTSSLTQNVKLHESENAWKPRNKLSLTDIAQEDLEIEELKRSVQGVLNKLTLQKCKTLLTQLQGLNIDTEEKLNVVIDLIFEKAIDEPNFSVAYANICRHLALIKVPLADQTGGQLSFHKLLLTKCQKEFEQDRSEHVERTKALEEAEPDKQKEMKLVFDLEEKKMRYRQLGNIRFIGELFKLGMLIEPIMHECIKKLLSQGDEESIECLCKLLKAIGKELDETKGGKSRDHSPMDMYFAEMQKFVDKRSTSSRVRFMLQDVIDLKKNSWVPRRDENMPKTIDQIHQEAEREAREQQINLQNMSSNYPKRMPDDRDRRKASGRNIGTSEDGWTSSSSKSNKGSYSALDPTKLKLTKPDEVESIRLGPGGRGLQSWGRGSSGGTKSTAEDVKTALTNRYSALSEQSVPSSNYDGRRGSQRSAASSRESSRGRSNQLPTAARKIPSTSKEREDLLETVKVFNRPTESKSQDTKKNTDVHVNGKAADPDELCLRGPEYSEEEMEKKTKPLIDEFLHNNDFEEAIKCVTELASPSTVYLFINTAINQVLERSSQARYSLGQLLFSLLKKKIISFEQYKKGVGSVLEIIDDYALDIPLIWDYMGEILEPMIEDIEFPLTFLKEILQPCIPSEKAGLLVSAILHCSAKRKGTIKLGEFWKESGLQWVDFLEAGADVNEFIKKHKLEFTVSPTKVKPKAQMTIEEIKKTLLSLLEKNEANETVFDWIDAIEAYVSGNGEPTFIRALVSAVHEDVISGSGATCELAVTQLKERLALLTRYINHNEKLERQALYAIQALMNQLGQPNGLLRQIFDILYDDDVITEETFKAWKSSTDPNESEGKGVAVHSVKSFFTWLRESESGEETE